MLLSGEDHPHLRLSIYRPFTALSSAADSLRARSMAARMLACSALSVPQASLQRTQERLQTDHRPAPEGPRSPHKPPQASGREQLRAGVKWQDNDLVFTTTIGT